MALQPVGPLPASTYWRRRLLLLVVLVVVLLVVVKAFGGGQAKKDVRSGPAPSPSPSVNRSLPPAPSSPASVPPSTSPLLTCGDSVLQVTTEADAQAYPSGAAPRFTLTVRNVGSVACRRALGPDAVELRVLSGEDRIWSSDDCNDAKGQGVMTLKPGEAQAMSVRWPGKRTKPDCKIGDVAQPGTYRVSARVGTIVRQGSVFRITG